MKGAILYIALLALLLPSCGDDDSPGPPSGDTTSPVRVLDLTCQCAGGSTVTLSWTAPGDDGTDGQASRYDVRYSQTTLVGAGWDTATIASSLPTPRAAGQPDSLTITNLTSGEWFFGLQAADEVPNWSSLSNVASVTVADTIPPSAVTDLAAVSASFTSVRLRWTTPGNDGAIGRASEHDLRYSVDPITEETWNDAVRVGGLPRPALPGTIRSFRVPGLAPSTSCSYALKTADGDSNWSALSNVVGRSTLAITTSQLTFSRWEMGVMGTVEWSPDGETLMAMADWQVIHHYDLYLIPASGGDPMELTYDDDLIFCSDPCWSPDGTQIAFVSNRVINQDEIFVMAATPGATAFQVTNFGSRQLHDCAWSPDGTRIAFSSNRSGNSEIYVVSAQGGEPTQLTNDPAWDGSPTWSPDGSEIAFSSTRSGGGDLWGMSSEGKGPTRLTSDPASEWLLSWSPNDNRIAFVRATSDRILDIYILTGQEAAQP